MSLPENELIFETRVIQNENYYLCKKLTEPFLMSALQLYQFHLVHEQQGTQVLMFQWISWSQQKHHNWQENKEKPIPQPSSFLNCFTTVVTPFFSPQTCSREKTNIITKWKKTVWCFIWICQHMPTSTPSKDNNLAPTSSCTWPKQCNAGVICERRSNKAWHPQWKKPSLDHNDDYCWPLIPMLRCLLMLSWWCFMNLMAEPEIWNDYEWTCR